jgi:hypothetical protein
MVLVTSPDGVLLGAGNTVGEVKRILIRASLEFAERRRHEVLTDRLLTAMVSNGSPASDSAANKVLLDFELLREKITADVMKFIDDCTMEEVE